MLIEVLRSKIHRATVTEMDLNYSGSIGIDRTLMRRAGIAENEKVLIANLKNGRRIETYAFSEPEDSGRICISGPAGRLCRVGNLVVIMAFGFVAMNEKITPKILIMDKHNRVKQNK